MPIVSLDQFERDALEQALTSGGVILTSDEEAQANRIIEAKYLTPDKRTRYVITHDGWKALRAAQELKA